MSYAQNYLKMDKIDRLLDALEYPDLYSEKDLEAMLDDTEVREAYNLIVKTKSALTPIPSPDVDAEWATFKKSHPATRRRATLRISSLFSRNIAASIAICIASLAAVAAVVGVSVNYLLKPKTQTSSDEIVAVSKENAVSTDTVISVEDAPSTAPETIVFDNEPLEAIITRIAEYHDCNVTFSSDAPKSLRLYFRWNQAQSLDDVVESLNNFEQINIAVEDKTIKID